MKILILGGSKFMGLDLVEKLINIKENENLFLEIFIINRGKIHWDGLFYKLIKGKEFVKHFISDRKNKIEFTNTIKLINEMDDSLFEFVIDFCCFSKKDFSVIDELNFKNYIFISTDSTYNASPVSLERDDKFFIENENNYSNVNALTEDYAFLSEDKLINKKLKKRDDYGYNKLKIEIEIKKKFKEERLIKNGSNFLILRLPDVIGSYDETFRMWFYIEWLKHLDFIPIELEKIDFVRKLSFVLKDDVNDLILKVIFNKIGMNIISEQTMNQEFNISCDETMTLFEILTYLCNYLKIELKYQIKEVATTYYPSVSIGHVDNTKAKKSLNFSPNSIYDGLNKEIEFYLYVDSLRNEKFYEEFKEMVKDLPKKIQKKIN